MESNIIIPRTALVPLGLVIVIISIVISGTFFISQIQADIERDRVMMERHIENQDVHQPYRDKLASWYTRQEGEATEESVILLEKRLDSIERKLDILIANDKNK